MLIRLLIRKDLSGPRQGIIWDTDMTTLTRRPKVSHHRFTSSSKKKKRTGIDPSPEAENEIVSDRKKDFARGISSGFKKKRGPSILSKFAKIFKSSMKKKK